MSVVIRLVKLSSSAAELLEQLAAQERIAPEIYGSLVLELAIRERHESNRRFADAAAKVLDRAV